LFTSLDISRQIPTLQQNGHSIGQRCTTISCNQAAFYLRTITSSTNVTHSNTYNFDRDTYTKHGALLENLFSCC